MKSKRISLRFNLDNEADRRAWESLHSVDSRSINGEIIARINAGQWEEILKSLIRQVIHEELSSAPVSSVVQQMPPMEEKELNDVFDFLDGF